MKPKPTLWLSVIIGKPGLQLTLRKPRKAWFAVEVEVRRGKK